MFALLVDRTQKALLARIFGDLTDAVLTDMEAAIRSILEVEGPLRRIVDLSDVGTVVVPQELLVARAKNRPLSPSRTPVRVFVAPTDYLFAISRMFTTYQATHGIDTMIVRKLEEAYRSLELKNPNFQPVR